MWAPNWPIRIEKRGIEFNFSLITSDRDRTGMWLNASAQDQSRNHWKQNAHRKLTKHGGGKWKKRDQNLVWSNDAIIGENFVKCWTELVRSILWIIINDCYQLLVNCVILKPQRSLIITNCKKIYSARWLRIHEDQTHAAWFMSRSFRTYWDSAPTPLPTQS